MLVAGSAALYFFFNVGQLSREKTKLVNTADAVAYSAGVVHARALNFNAYSNRALIANEVLIAQMVSMHSWAGYMATWEDNLPSVHQECIQLAGGNYYAAAIMPFKYGVDYVAACMLIAAEINYTGGIFAQIAEVVQAAIEAIVPAIEVQKAVIQAAQIAIDAAVKFDRDKVMDEVAKANYVDDGNVTVEKLSPTLPDDWFRMPGGGRFIKRYTGDERSRFKEVTVAAANSDPFIPERRWTSRALLPNPECFPTMTPIQFNEVRRRGGTELLGFDEWQAVDTQSYHHWYLSKSKGVPTCKRDERETGYASAEAYRSGAQQNSESETFGGSRTDNPRAYYEAVSNSSGSGMGYQGLPNYYDLNAIWLSGARKEDEPELRFGVRLTRHKSDLRTTDGGNGQIHTRSDSRIAAYDSDVAASEMAAVSASEVYFARPPDEPDNIYGAKKGLPRELGSLFNPFWQVRLAPIDPTSEWVYQGVGS